MNDTSQSALGSVWRQARWLRCNRIAGAVCGGRAPALVDARSRATGTPARVGSAFPMLDARVLVFVKRAGRARATSGHVMDVVRALTDLACRLEEPAARRIPLKS
jgi:hypothetical protein